MTRDKCLEVLDLYEKFLCSVWTRQQKDRDTVQHLLLMIPNMRTMLDHVPKLASEAKFMRWLGFIQGVLWQRRWFTLEELKEHNRP